MRPSLNGLIVPVQDSVALASAIASVLASGPDHLEAMGLEGRRFAEERFDVRFVNADIIHAWIEPDFNSSLNNQFNVNILNI